MDKKTSRIRRSRKTRARIKQSGSYRLTVHRTPRHIYAQVIAPSGCSVVAAASTVESEIRKDAGYTGNTKAAEVVGRVVAERAKSAGVTKVSFDRSGFQYHGRVKALAEAARQAGLEF